MSEFFEELLASTAPVVYKFFDGDAWVGSSGNALMDIISPVDEQVMGKVPVVTAEEIGRVVARAKSAQLDWFATPLDKRITVVHLAADWIREHADYFTNLLVMEIGKTVEESRAEVLRTADLLEYTADEARSLRGEELQSDAFPGFEKGKIALVDRVPWGTVLAIGPFNYPLNLVASKIAPALIMGNACIVKPPTNGSISGLHLVQAFVRSGVPKGVLSCVTGGGSEVGDVLVRHPDISMIALTGSTATGKHIASVVGMKPLLFELGGNNPVLVLDSADKPFTAKELVKGAFSYAGQRCTAIKYVLAYRSVIDDIIDHIHPLLADMVKKGDPRDSQTKLVGPVISATSAQSIKQRIDDAVNQGAVVVAGGSVQGNYVEPTILKNVRPDMEIIRTETFGPVLSFVEIQSVEEAVNIINASSYGLQVSIFTKDEQAGMTIAQQINVGTVQINSSPQRGPDHFPFMGIKDSGLGVQGVQYSLEAMSRLKSVVLNKMI